MRKQTAIVLILAILLGMTACANPEKDWQEQYDLGMRYLREGDYEEAILAFSAAIEIDDSRPEAYMGRAEAYEAIGDHEKALRDYKKARKIAKANDDEDLVEDLEEIIEDLEEIIENGEEDRPVSDDEIPGEEGPQDFAITVTDAYSDYITGYYYGDYAYCYHIPQINLRDDLAAEVNREIYDTLYPILEDVYGCLNDYGYASYGKMAYAWYTEGTLLSVVVEVEFAQWPWTDYYIYTVSVETGECVSNEELLAAYGLDMEQYYSMAGATMEAAFASGYTEDMIDNVGRELYNSLISQSVSAENLSRSVPYIGENGSLCMAAAQYSPAAAEYYWHLYDLKEQVRLNYIQCTAEHSAVDDAPAAYSVEEITRMVVDWYNTHPVGDGEHGYMAYETETYVENGKCIITVRYDESGSNIRVDTAEVDMITGEFWADGYYVDDLW